MNSTDPRHSADEAASRLREALLAHGLDFPELGLHFPAVMAGHPMISCGTITVETANQLTALLLARVA